MAHDERVHLKFAAPEDEYDDGEDDDRVDVSYLNEQNSQDTEQSEQEYRCCKKDITVFCMKSWQMWKYITLALDAIWILCMILLVALPMDTVHDIIQILYPDATKLFNSDSEFVNDCSLNFDNILSHMNVFLFFHWLRYFVAALQFRNRLVCWTNSLLWEIVETAITRVGVFKLNFYECWWDSWLFDFLIMNALGIEMGLLLANKTNWMKGYPEFTRILTTKEGYTANLFAWLVIYACIVLALMEETLVFLMFVVALWLQTVGTWLVYIRTAAWWLSLLYSTSQVYHYIMQDHMHSKTIKNRVKAMYFVLILSVMCLLELIMTIKGYAQY